MIQLLHLALIFRCFRNIEMKTLAIQFAIGGLYYIIFVFGYQIIYSNNWYQSNILVDLGITTMGSGNCHGSVLNWSRRNYLHRMYYKTILDPDKNYLMHFKTPNNIDIIRNTNRIAIKSNKLIRFQNTNYYILSIIFGFILPSAICYHFTHNLWSSLISNIPRIVFFWHLTNIPLSFFLDSVTFVKQRLYRIYKSTGVRQ